MIRIRVQDQIFTVGFVELNLRSLAGGLVTARVAEAQFPPSCGTQGGSK